MNNNFKMFFRYAIPIFLLFVIAITSFQFGSDGQNYIERASWYEGGPGAPNLYPGRNFHTCDIDKYPEIGFVLHSVEVEKWDKEAEKRSIHEGIDVLRKEFSSAWHENSIMARDSFKKYKSKWLPPGNLPLVRFRPKWIVMIIRNNADYKMFEKYENDSDIPSKDIFFPYKVGYMFKATDVFDKEAKTTDIVSKGFRDEHPQSLDKKAKYPGRETIYDIVVRYNKNHKEKAVIRTEEAEQQ